MKSLAIAMVLFSLLDLHSVASKSVVQVQGVEKCTIPRKFEGKIKVNVTVTAPSGITQNAIGIGSFHVDATNGRAAIFETVHTQGQTTKVSVIMTEAEVGKTTSVYYAFPDLKKCMNNQVNAPILPGALPKNTTLKIKEGILAGIPAQIWEAEINEGPVSGHAEMYLTRDTCMPMRVNLRLMVNGLRMMGTEYFDDMKEGVEDESIFDIPEYCAKQEHVKQQHVEQGGDVDQGVSGVDVDHERHLEHATARLRVRRHLLF